MNGKAQELNLSAVRINPRVVVQNILNQYPQEPLSKAERARIALALARAGVDNAQLRYEAGTCRGLLQKVLGLI